MFKRMWLVLVTLTLLGGFWAGSFQPTFAAEDDTSAQVENGDSENTIDVGGPGAVIIMIGLLVIGIVSFTYSAKHQDEPANS